MVAQKPSAFLIEGIIQGGKLSHNLLLIPTKSTTYFFYPVSLAQSYIRLMVNEL